MIYLASTGRTPHFFSTPEQLAEAAAKYEKIPVVVRAILPPFSVYILWSTS